MSESLFFYLASSAALASAVGVVTARNPMRAVLSLVVTMFCLAVLFVLLGAYFIAVIHLLVYAGAILVLFLFVVMLLGLAREERTQPAQTGIRIFGTLVVIALLVALIRVFFAVPPAAEAAPRVISGSIEAVGRLLFTRYLIPFELTSVLLLVGMIGAVVLAKKEPA